MYGFTIVLRRKKYSPRFKNITKETTPEQSRRRSKPKKAKKNFKFPFKISKLMPLTFLVFALTVSVILSNKEPATESNTQPVQTSTFSLNALSKDAYSFYYIPVVINDIESFDYGKSKLSDEMIAACCWSLIGDEKSEEKYEYFEDKTVIPSKEVEERFSQLFGNKITFENKSININNCKFEYADDIYCVAITGITPEFLPKLLKFESDGENVILTVGCLKNDEYVQDANGNIVEPEPYKKLEIVLCENEDKEDKYFIKNIKLI